MPADAIDYKYYQYEDSFGNFWSIKQDKSWGDNADAGFQAAQKADPVMVKSPSLRPRMIYLQDPTSGRVTTRVVATTTATAWSNPSYTTTVKFRGLATGVTCEKFDQRDEHIRKPRTIYNKPEPV